MALIGAALGAWFFSREPYTPPPLPSVRPSRDLNATLMVATLETPLPEGKSVIWCGAFQLAWNRLKSDVVREPLRVQGADALCTTLNSSPFGDADLAPDSFYAAAGMTTDGILNRIRSEMKGRFPEIQPSLPEGADLSAVAYAYLAATLKFKHAYRDQQEGIAFREGSGNLKRVRGFGVLPRDAHHFHDAFYQPWVLHHGSANPVDEVVVDLDPTSSPHQILVAMMKRPASLAEAVSWVHEKTRGDEARGFMGGETLLVPEVAIGILHRFAELEGKVVLNKALQGNFISVAQQSVQFRLHRGGAELRAEAALATAKAAGPREKPLQIIFDRPFLLIMKRRASPRPYFAAWVDNVELLESR